jgi:hypothetical protein
MDQGLFSGITDTLSNVADRANKALGLNTSDKQVKDTTQLNQITTNNNVHEEDNKEENPLIQPLVPDKQIKEINKSNEQQPLQGGKKLKRRTNKKNKTLKKGKKAKKVIKNKHTNKTHVKTIHKQKHNGIHVKSAKANKKILHKSRKHTGKKTAKHTRK